VSKIVEFIPDVDADEAGAQHPTPLKFADIGAWATRTPPEREWAVRDRFPLRNVSILSGEGSTGKSILIMQLGAAHVLARDWAHTLPEPGRFSTSAPRTTRTSLNAGSARSPHTTARHCPS